MLGNRNVLTKAAAPSLSVDGISGEQVTKTKLLGVKLDNLSLGLITLFP